MVSHIASIASIVDVITGCEPYIAVASRAVIVVLPRESMTAYDAATYHRGHTVHFSGGSSGLGFASILTAGYTVRSVRRVIAVAGCWR